MKNKYNLQRSLPLIRMIGKPEKRQARILPLEKWPNSPLFIQTEDNEKQKPIKPEAKKPFTSRGKKKENKDISENTD